MDKQETKARRLKNLNDAKAHIEAAILLADKNGDSVLGLILRTLKELNAEMIEGVENDSLSDDEFYQKLVVMDRLLDRSVEVCDVFLNAIDTANGVQSGS